jgi:hypothetical protein
MVPINETLPPFASDEVKSAHANLQAVISRFNRILFDEHILNERVEMLQAKAISASDEILNARTHV